MGLWWYNIHIQYIKREIYQIQNYYTDFNYWEYFFLENSINIFMNYSKVVQ